MYTHSRLKNCKPTSLVNYVAHKTTQKSAIKTFTTFDALAGLNDFRPYAQTLLIPWGSGRTYRGRSPISSYCEQDNAENSYKNQGNTRNLLSLLYFANCLPLPTIALLSTHMHSMLMAIHAFTFFHRFQHSQKGGRHQVSDLMRAQPLKLLNGRETVARCYMPIKCQAWRVRPFVFAANLHCIWAPNLETGCHGLTVTCGCHTTWWPGHMAQHFSQHLLLVHIPCEIPKVHPKPSTLKVQTLDLGRTLVSYDMIKVAWRYLSLDMVNLRIHWVNSTKTSF